ncbi:MAG: ABC transporter permease [Cyclobacteriaceae bacterium]
MIYHQLKIAFRRLWANKLFSLISIIGLAVGLTTFLIIFHFTTFELSFDHFHKNKDEIYRVVCYPNDGKKQPSARNYKGLGLLIKDQFPEVKQVVRFWKVWNRNDGEAIKANGKIFYEQKIIQSDPSFFKVFPALLKRGEPELVLREPNSIVLSDSKAKNYFGDTDPIGRIISDGDINLTVTGIMYDIPINSHLDIEVVRTFSDDFFLQDGWQGFYLYTYLTLDSKTTAEAFQMKLETAIRAKRTEFEDLANVSFELQPITEIHLSPNLSQELTTNSNKTLVFFLMGIGFLIITMVWINHMTLSISSFFSRAKELSIRGIVGADRSNLIRQLLLEYLMLIGLSIPLAVFVTIISNQYFVEEGFIPDISKDLYYPQMWVVGIMVLLLGSVLTGLFPSFLIRKVDLSGELKTRALRSLSGNKFRSAMVILQFISSIILVSGVVVMSLQLQHLRSGNKNMVIDKVIGIRNPTAYAEFESDETEIKDYKLFKELLENNPVIEQVASSSAIPGSPIGFSTTEGIKRSLDDPLDPIQMKVIYVDNSFLNVYSIPLLAGRSFSDQNTNDLDEKSIMLSEAAIRHLGFALPESAIGQKIQYHMWNRWNTYEIIGVYKDYAHESQKSEPYPSILYFNRYRDDYGSYVMHQSFHSVKIANGVDIGVALAHIQKIWETIWPEKPMEYNFVEQLYEQQYHAENVLATSFSLFSLVAISLALLGVFGITHFEVQHKLKEISIRKVLGSSIRSIIKLMAKKYVGLILISALLATPVSYLLADEWLSVYPVRIALHLWLFMIPIALLLLLVMLTSGSLIWKSANTNPAEVLRSE